MSAGPAWDPLGRGPSALLDHWFRDVESDGAGRSHPFTSPRGYSDTWIPTPPIGGSKR